MPAWEGKELLMHRRAERFSAPVIDYNKALSNFLYVLQDIVECERKAFKFCRLHTFH